MQKTISVLNEKQKNEYETHLNRIIELRACRKDPKYFLTNYVQIQTRTKPPKTISWLPWPYLLDLVDLLLTEHDLIIIKARQLGISWLVSALSLWEVLFSDGGKAIFFSQGERESWEMVRKSRFIWNHLPDWMKVAIGRDTRETIEFPFNDGVIEGLPSTEKAGRSTDATRLVRDELAYHPYAEANFSAVGPTIDSGGFAVDLSTIDREAGPNDPSYHFTERVLKAKSGATYDEIRPSGIRVLRGGESGATLVFLHWKLRPTRIEGMTLDQWYELRIKPKYGAEKRRGEYPLTLEEALSVPETSAFFDREALSDMLLETHVPISTSRINLRDGIVRIHKLPMIGKHYVLFTDPSDGIDDPFATVVIDTTGEQVAGAHGKLRAPEVAQIHDELARLYNNAYNTLEINTTSGGKCVETLKLLKTPNMAPRRSPEGKVIAGKEGWQTNQPLRDRALNHLEEAIRNRIITIRDREALDELQSFARIDGKVQAPRGMHDDWVMAWAGAWYLKKFFIPSDQITIQSGKYHN